MTMIFAPLKREGSGGNRYPKISSGQRRLGAFLIQFMAEQITSGLRGNNYAAAAKAVNDKFEENVSEAQVYNHLRT